MPRRASQLVTLDYAGVRPRPRPRTGWYWLWLTLKLYLVAGLVIEFIVFAWLFYRWLYRPDVR